MLLQIAKWSSLLLATLDRRCDQARHHMAFQGWQVQCRSSRSFGSQVVPESRAFSQQICFGKNFYLYNVVIVVAFFETSLLPFFLTFFFWFAIFFYSNFSTLLKVALVPARLIRRLVCSTARAIGHTLWLVAIVATLCAFGNTFRSTWAVVHCKIQATTSAQFKSRFAGKIDLRLKSFIYAFLFRWSFVWKRNETKLTNNVSRAANPFTNHDPETSEAVRSLFQELRLAFPDIPNKAPFKFDNSRAYGTKGSVRVSESTFRNAGGWDFCKNKTEKRYSQLCFFLANNNKPQQ